MNDLFRTEVGENHLSAIGVPLKITTRWMRFFTFSIVISIALLSALIWHGSYTRKATVEGFLFPDKGVIKLSSPREGRIIESNVEEGQHVEIGDVLFVIGVDVESVGGSTIDSAFSSLQNSKSLLQEELRRARVIETIAVNKLGIQLDLKVKEIALLNEEVTSHVESIGLLERILERYLDFSSRKISSVTTLEAAEKELFAAQFQLISSNRQLVNTQSEYLLLQTEPASLKEQHENIRSRIQQELITIQQQLSELDDKRAVLIRAPETGIVTQLTSTIGDSVDMDSILLSLMPDGAVLEAYLYIPSKDAGFISNGVEILLRYDAYPYQKFGLQKAYVKTISQASVTSSELPYPISGNTVEPVYVVIAELEKAFISISGVERPLQVGTKFQADLVLEQRKIWEWLLGPVRILSSKL